MFNGSIVADGNKKQVLADGIFYTTSMNKLFRDRDNSIFTLEEALERCSI
jgi:energy-coupling factor transport system ATP-binding protein